MVPGGVKGCDCATWQARDPQLRSRLAAYQPRMINYLEDNQIKVSIDEKRRATNNVWIERFWKSLKCNHVYLNPSDTGLELFEGVQ